MNIWISRSMINFVYKLEHQSTKYSPQPLNVYLSYLASTQINLSSLIINHRLLTGHVSSSRGWLLRARTRLQGFKHVSILLHTHFLDTKLSRDCMHAMGMHIMGCGSWMNNIIDSVCRKYNIHGIAPPIQPASVRMRTRVKQWLQIYSCTHNHTIIITSPSVGRKQTS